MRKALAVVLVAMACSAVSSAQHLEVHLTHAEPGDPLRAGALYTATPISGWVYIDLALAPLIRGDIRPHRDIYLVGHEGTRFPLPDLRTYRANRETIREVFGAIAVSESAGVFPIARHYSVGCDEGGPVFCRRYALWRFTAGPVNRVITFNRSVVVQTELLFEAPPGGWAAGDYVLTIDGPGDSVTELPVRIG